MTLHDFIIKVSCLYENAYKKKCCSDKVFRGRSHVISSETEDLFAYFLVENDKKIEMILVDQSITIPADVKEKQKRLQVYSDIVIFKNNEITALIDLKMDLGRNRDGLIKTGEKHRKMVEFSRGKTGRYQHKVENKTAEKEARNVIFSDTLSYSIVIVSGKNISSEKLEKQISLTNSISDAVNVYTLSNGIHPNAYWRSNNEKNKEKLIVNHDQFSDLLERIS